MNKYTGDFPVEMGGETYTLKFDWTALARIKSELPSKSIGELLTGGDPLALATIAAIGFGRHHPGLKPTDVITMSPPVEPLVRAITGALNYAYHGPDQPSQADEERPENPPRRTATKSLNVFGWLLRLVFRRPSSGA